MFKKLYRALLIQNIAIISLLLFIVFSGLYLSTYFDINSGIDKELENITKAYTHSPQATPDLNRINRQAFFIVEVESDGDLTLKESRFMLEPSTLVTLFEDVTSKDGQASYNDQVWNYLQFEHNGKEFIVFMNTTIDQALLSSTLFRFSLLYVLSILLTTLISSIITRRSIRPVKESFDKQKQFVSDASHELKTPLTVINTNVDILISEDTTDNKWLRYIKSEVERMSKLTHDLLYLSKMTESDKERTLKTQFNVSNLVESLSLSIEALAYEKGITLEVDIDPNLQIEFNQEQFHQVAMILMDNAIKYTNKDGLIQISLKQNSSYISFDVSNTGKGIPEEDIPHIFDRFYKVDKSREETSNSFGLGLPIAKSICDNHNVKITVKSQEGKDTSFTIKLKAI